MATTSRDRRPGTRSRGRGAAAAFGFILLFAGLIGGGVLFVLSLQRHDKAIEKFARAGVGCTTSLEFSKSGTFYVYEETEGEFDPQEIGCEPAATPGQAFGFDFLGAGALRVAMFLLGCFLTALVIGLLVCALVLLFGTRAETSAWAAVNFFVMLSGIYYPISVLPGWAQAVSAGIPLTYFLDGIRAGYGFPSAYAHPFAIGFLLSLLYVLLAHWALAAAVTRSRRTGLLLKLSE